MTPTPKQIRQALLNHRLKPTTRGARIRAALEHVVESKKKPRANDGAFNHRDMNIHIHVRATLNRTLVLSHPKEGGCITCSLNH